MRHPSLVPLSRDHHEGLTLALQCRKQGLGHLKPAGQEGLIKRAREMRQFFTDRLEGHFRAEERVLFPCMRECVPRSESLVERMLQQHREIRALVVRLNEDGQLGKNLFDLGDLLERHIRTEERELFPMFEKEVNPLEADRVGNEMAQFLQGKPR